MASSAREKTLFGHPSGLTTLFLTQTWAEFSYFGLLAMLVYYMTQHLQIPQAQASMIFGVYGAVTFLSPFFGGIIADRLIGKTKSVVIGGVMMMLGHFMMAFETMLFPALALVALGNGLFIPPLAVQVGQLYAPGDARRDQAFSAYYMGINVGGFLAPLICGYLGETYGWHWGFAVAGVGMAIGLIVYLTGQRTLPSGAAADPAAAVTPASAPFSKDDWRALYALLAIMAVVVLFRIAYEQSGNTIALWVSDRTDRVLQAWGGTWTIPATWFQSINPLLIITLTPFLIAHWQKRKAAGHTGNLLQRMSLGCAITGFASLVMIAASLVAPVQGLVSPLWVIGYFVLLTLGELLVIPIGLSIFVKLSPVQIASTMMGAWYIAKFIGSLAAGFVGTFWLVIPSEWFFAIGAGTTFAASGILLLMSRNSAAAQEN